MNSYLSCGNIMSDVILEPSGYKSARNMGGPAFFALAGMRLWTDDCLLVTATGRNYSEDYGQWMLAHGVSQQHVRVEAENVTCYQIAYNNDGTSNREKSFSFYGDENMGYLKTHPRHIAKAATTNTKGIYMAQGADKVVWQQLAKIKQQMGFKIMWELEYFNSGKDLARVKEALPFADAWSLNHNEAQGLFNIPRENDEYMIKTLQQLPITFVFYRVGKRGAFAITPTQSLFCPAIDVGPYVDQTGCGNCSTGAAMYAYVAGHSMQEVLLMANIAAGYNCLQYGPYPLFTTSVREKALALKESLKNCIR